MPLGRSGVHYGRARLPERRRLTQAPDCPSKNSADTGPDLDNNGQL